MSGRRDGDRCKAQSVRRFGVALGKGLEEVEAEVRGITLYGSIGAAAQVFASERAEAEDRGDGPFLVSAFQDSVNVFPI